MNFQSVLSRLTESEGQKCKWCGEKVEGKGFNLGHDKSKKLIFCDKDCADEWKAEKGQ